MAYMCPKCGECERLFVVRATVIGDMPIADDGFEITGSTEDEVILCKECTYEADIGTFILPEESDSIVAEITKLQMDIESLGRKLNTLQEEYNRIEVEQHNLVIVRSVKQNLLDEMD